MTTEIAALTFSTDRMRWMLKRENLRQALACGCVDCFIDAFIAREEMRFFVTEYAAHRPPLTKLINGYTLEQLKIAFDAAHEPGDWKAPIAVSAPGEYVNLIVAAIMFYTATVPVVSLNVETMEYIITSEGYRAGPAGDH